MNSNKIRLFSIIMLSLLYFSSLQGQENKYWVFFSDKDGTTFNPIEYFDAKAIERRLIHGLNLDDISDYPVRQDYIQKIEKEVNKTGYSSRWFNALSVIATETQIQNISKFPFVIDIQEQIIHTELCESPSQNAGPNSNIELANKQMELMQSKLFSKNNITGKGIRIAIFDGGFPEVDTHKAFEHVRKNNRIIKTWNFCNNKEFVYAYNSHGLSVMSNICGIYEGTQLGVATEAEFLLARTEVNPEPFAEEEWWLAAVEWADKNGAHVINSSLGYTYHRYFPEQMDGKTSLVARAANMAAAKGIIVVNAMGNDGTNSWKAVGTPADADSVLSVGGIEPFTEYKINFSSFGPTVDGRLKPNVTNSGHAAVAVKKDKLGNAYGTSFASPLTCGFVACALQTMPETKAMNMIREIEKSGNLYPYYDYAHGYGVPQSSFFTKENKTPPQKQFDFIFQNDTLIVSLLPEEINNNPELNKTSDKYLYYHIMLPDGKLFKYGLISVSESEPLKLNLKEVPDNVTVRVLYKQYLKEWKNIK